jgi:hypothetical protein
MNYIHALDITQLPFPKFIGVKYYKEYKLHSTLFLEQWRIPEGITVKIFQDKNFGWCILPVDCRDERGFIISRRIFRY